MRKMIIALVAVSAITWIIACSSSPEEPLKNNPVVENAVVEAKTPEFFVSLRLPGASDQYWQAIEQGALAKAKELGATITVQAAPSPNDGQAQWKQLDEQVAKGISGIIVAPIDMQVLATEVQRLKTAQIPLVFIDTQGTLEGVSYIGTNEYEAGKLAADFICNPENNLTPRNSEVMLLTGVTDSVVDQERLRGSREVLESCTLKIVATENANGDRTTAQTMTSDILTRLPDIKAIVAMNDSMALGAVDALKAMGKSGQVVIVGFDGSPEAVQSIAAGEMFATIARNPYNIGAWSVEHLYNLVQGETIAETIDTGTILVTSNNIDQFK